LNRLIIAFLIMFLTVVSASSAFAADTAKPFEIDGSFALAKGPDDFNSARSVNFGVGYTLTSVSENLQVRVDLSYFKFYYGNSRTLIYERMPVTVSGRYYFPITDRLKAFAQAGLEKSYDAKDRYLFIDMIGTENRTSLGFSPGGGIDFAINPTFSFFALGRFHVITDQYFSMQVGSAVHF